MVHEHEYGGRGEATSTHMCMSASKVGGLIPHDARSRLSAIRLIVGAQGPRSPVAWCGGMICTRLGYDRGPDLAPDLPTRRQVRVYIGVGHPRPDGRDDGGEIPSHELLAGRGPGHDIGGRDRPRNRAGLWTRLGPIWTGVRRRAAEPDHDAPVYAPLAHMDVALGHRPLQPAVHQLVVDGLLVLANRGVELAMGDRGYRRHLLVADQRGLNKFSAGHGGHG